MWPLITGLVLAATASLAALAARTLTPNGALAATGVGAAIFAAGGLRWTALMLLFFLSGSALSLLPSRGAQGVIAKGAVRDATQVLANGGVPAVLALLMLAHSSPLWAVGFAASIAGATADTWATEFGMRGAEAPRRITTGERLVAGMSGGVTLLGLLAAATGSCVLSGLALLVIPLDPAGTATVAVAGVGGSLLDSLLGATIQEVRSCPRCWMRTEQRRHAPCGTTTVQVGGVRGVNNDVVNLLAGAFAALLGCALARLFAAGY